MPKNEEVDQMIMQQARLGAERDQHIESIKEALTQATYFRKVSNCYLRYADIKRKQITLIDLIKKKLDQQIDERLH